MSKIQNIDVRFNATSNFAKVEADLAALRAQAAALGSVFQKGAYAKQGQLVADPKQWKAASNAVHQASQVYRNAAASSGLLTTQQIRATSESDKFTKALQKQKLTFGDMVKNRGVMREVYRDQLRFQRMTAQYWGTDMAGRHITDISVPKNVPTDLNNMRRQMGMFGNMARSAGNQIVNLGKNIQWSGRQLMVGFTYPLALFGAAAGVMAYKVEDAFGSINKVYDVSARALEDQALRTKELGDMRVESMEMATRVAEKYGITIDKTLAVEQQLAATGLKGAKLVSSTEEVQRISAIGDIEPTVTTEMVVALQTAFKDTIRDGEDLTNVLNFMNATSNATSLSLQDIAEATPRAASGLSQLGVTAEQMTIMLVSMREAGVQADEGANALKSATTRILNPAIVQKAQDLYKKAGASFNLKDIVDKSQGNLFDFIRMLGKATRASKEMSQQEKASAVAALFGTYQFNRLNAAIVNLGDAKAGENNQTAKAIALQQKSNEELANQAKISEDLMMSTPAAKLRKAWAEFQIQLSEMGKPFLVAVTEILKGGEKLLDWFNGLSDTKKKFAMYAAGALALVGPVIMLTGLFFNLFGQFVKGVGNIARFIGVSQLLTKEEQANALATEAQNKAFMSQQQQTSTLAKEVQVLAEAYGRATAAAKQFIATVGTSVMPGPAGTPKGIPAKWATVPTTQSMLIPGAYAGQGAASGGRYTLTPQEQRYFSATSATTTTGTTPNSVRLEQARNKLAYDYMRANGQVARDATKAEKSFAAQTRMQEKLKKGVSGTGLAVGAMSVGMAGMMLSTDKTSQKFFQMLMVGGLVVPMIAGMLKGMQALGAATKIAVAAQWASVAAGGAATATTAANAGLWKVMTMNVRAFGASLNAAMGPIGWIALAVTAIGAAIWVWHRHNEKILEDQREQARNQAELVKGTDAWAASVGKAADAYKMYSNIVASQKEKTQFDTDLTFYKSDDQKEEREAYAGLDPDQKHAHDLLKLTDLMKKYGLSQKEAQANMVAFYSANGAGMLEAKLNARNLVNEMGKMKDFNWQGVFKTGVDNLYNSTEELVQGNPEKVKALGMQLGGIYNEAFLGAATPAKAAGVFEGMRQKIIEPWEELRQQMLDKPATFDVDSKMLSNANELRAAYFRMSDEQKKMAFNYKTLTGEGTTELQTGLTKAANRAATIERALIRGIGAAGGLSDKVDTLGEYLQQAVVWANMLDFGQAKDKAEDLMQGLVKDNLMLSLDVNLGIQNKDDLQRLMDSADPEKIEEVEIAIRAMADANNIKPGKDILQTYWNLMHGVKIEAKGAKDDVKDVSDEIKNLKDKDISIKIKQVGGIVQSAMSGVQEDMATSASDAFDRQWDARMAGAQDAWDSRSDALQASHDRAQRALDRSQENAMDAFENRWERRKNAVNNAYEARIKHIQNEIEKEQEADQVRQRLFEREKARLQRLAEMENANIDFNTAMREGRLDDAAKTLNNAGVSGANAAMDAEQAAASARTEAKIKALEKKNERLEKQRDKEVKQLEKMEERMRKHLERVQDARRRALERQQQQEQKALEKSEEKAMDSMERKRDYEKAMLDQRLELFKAYTARNQKDLERWMNKVGLTYDDFGTDVKAKGEAWSKYFQKSLSDHIRQAGTEVANDNMWENVGKKIANKLLKGLGFDNLAEFNRFVRTGSKSPGKGGDGETRHEGGVVGSGKGSRGNIPNTFKGLHRSEKMIRAQKGEYVVNTKATDKYGPLLDAINSGTDISPGEGAIGETFATLPAGYGGPVAMVSAVLTQMLAKGLGKTFANLNAIGQAKAAAAAATSGSFKGIAGTYGGRTFSKEQMRNAATIASVGADMGMNSRDIMIGIMTAITESGLVNIHGGDRDSQGLFQQRPSMGWGTVAQVTNPEYAARAFFGPLRAHGERSSETPWLAAQHIQRSAFSDGSNYHAWWAAAQAIWNKGLKKNKGGGTSAGYVPGAGGRHRPINGPVTNGLHGGSSAGDPPAVDMAGPVGRNVYAVADGIITSSRDIAGPLASDTYNGSGPYGSFGRVIQMHTDSGAGILYGHLSKRFASTGQRVKGGAVLGLSGNTGNSSGAHLHFGATNGPYAWLRTGGTIRHDNTPVIAHRGETMLDASLTKKFRENVGGGGGGDTFNMTLDFRGAMIKENVDIEKAINTAIDNRESKVGRRRVVN